MIFCENEKCEYNIHVDDRSIRHGEIEYLDSNELYTIKHYPYKSVSTGKIIFLCEACKGAIETINKHNQ